MQATGKFKDKLENKKIEMKKKSAPSSLCSPMLVSVIGVLEGVFYLSLFS